MGLRRYEGAQRMLAALRPPLPLGEGWGEGAQGKPPAGYSKESHRQSCWGALTRPSATLSQRERGWVCDGTRVPSACSPPSDPLSLWERVGVRVAKSTAPPSTARNRTGRAVGAPSPGLRPPSPRGRGVGFATVRGCPAHAPPPSDPLSLWERVGVRVAKASSPPGTARNPQAELLGSPHPAFGHPLPEGEGLGLRRYEGAQRMLTALRPPLPLGEGWGEGAQGNCPAGYGKESHRQSCWGALTRPSATLSQRERGWVCDGTRVPSACSPPSGPLSLWERVGVRVAKASSPPGTARNRTGRAVGEPSPGLRPPSPKGRGVGFATVRGCPAHAPPPSDPLSLWERVGVRVAKASSPPGTARNPQAELLGRPHPAFGHPLPEGEGLGLRRYEGAQRMLHRPPTPSPSGRGLG